MDGGEAQAIAATFELGTLQASPVLAARGANGFIWKVTTERGVYAVKRLQPWVGDEAVPFDVGVQLAALDAGINLPRPVLTADGEAVVAGSRVYEWVDLRDQVDTPVPPSRAAEVGTILGRLHAMALPPDEAIHPWYVDPPGREDWLHLEHRGRDAGAPWAAWLADEIDFLDELGSKVGVPRPGPTITCHRDFAPGNVLPAASDGALVVLDWENAGALPADAELVWTLVLWATNGDRIDLDAVAALLDAYAESRHIPDIATSSFHVAVVTHLNYLKVCCDHSIDGSLKGEFTDVWIDRLQPLSLRRRLSAMERLRAFLDER